MFQAIAAVVSSALNLGASVNNADSAKYDRYLNDRNASLYGYQLDRQYRTYSNMALLIGIVLIGILIMIVLFKKLK